MSENDVYNITDEDILSSLDAPVSGQLLDQDLFFHKFTPWL